MYTLTGKHSFDSAHYLKGHDGKCKNLHGHRWTVEYAIKADKLYEEGPKRGMVLDFGDLKQHVNSLIDAYDHALLIEEDNQTPEEEAFIGACRDLGFHLIFLPFRTTAENFAKHLFQQIQEYLDTCGNPNAMRLWKVTVFETPNNCASYSLEG